MSISIKGRDANDPLTKNETVTCYPPWFRLLIVPVNSVEQSEKLSLRTLPLLGFATVFEVLSW